MELVRTTVWATRPRMMRDRMPMRRLRLWIMMVVMGIIFRNRTGLYYLTMYSHVTEVCRRSYITLSWLYVRMRSLDFAIVAVYQGECEIDMVRFALAYFCLAIELMHAPVVLCGLPARAVFLRGSRML
jgi:hypothetical protein